MADCDIRHEWVPRVRIPRATFVILWLSHFSFFIIVLAFFASSWICSKVLWTPLSLSSSIVIPRFEDSPSCCGLTSTDRRNWTTCRTTPTFLTGSGRWRNIPTPCPIYSFMDHRGRGKRLAFLPCCENCTVRRRHGSNSTNVPLPHQPNDKLKLISSRPIITLNSVPAMPV
jgi:hypothetical protein